MDFILLLNYISIFERCRSSRLLMLNACMKVIKDTYSKGNLHKIFKDVLPISAAFVVWAKSTIAKQNIFQ